MSLTESAAQPIGIITGPTCSGKTALALEWARRNPALELVNADSLLFYRYVSIGTAKPEPHELAEVPHHLVDIKDPDEPFTAGDFTRAAEIAFREIEARGKRPLVVGGSGFYLKALLYGLWDAPKADPELRARLEATPQHELYERLMKLDEPAALRISANDRYRLIRATELFEMTGKTPTELEAESPQEPSPRFHLWVVDRSKEEIDGRIGDRTESMIQRGLVEEARALLERWGDVRALNSVGYRQVLSYLRGEKHPSRAVRAGLDGLAEEITLATRQLVRKQRTWFRGESASQHFQLDADRARLDQAFIQVYG